jgi:hypothetical protein
MQEELGSQWERIASLLPGKPSVQVKYRCTNLRKKKQKAAAAVEQHSLAPPAPAPATDTLDIMCGWCAKFRAPISNSNASDIDSSIASDIERDTGSDSEQDQLFSSPSSAELDLAVFNTDPSGDLAGMDNQAQDSCVSRNGSIVSKTVLPGGCAGRVHGCDVAGVHGIKAHRGACSPGVLPMRRCRGN